MNNSDKNLINIIETDINNQSISLKERLENRKKKQQYSDFTSSNSRSQTQKNSSSIIPTKRNTNLTTNSITEIAELNDAYFNTETSIDENNISETLSPQKFKEQEKINHNNIITKLNTLTDNYYISIKNYFINNVFLELFISIQSLNNQRANDKFNIIQNFQNQIEEMKALIQFDNMNKNHIQLIIDNISEERDEEISKINEKYEERIKNVITSSRGNNYKENTYIRNTNKRYIEQIINMFNNIN